MNIRSIIGLLAAVCITAGCNTVSRSALPAFSQTTSTGQSRRAWISLAIKIPDRPHRAATPAYISAGSQSIAIQVAGSAIFANIGPGSSECKTVSGGRICTFENIGAYIGRNEFHVTVYDGALSASGRPTGKILSTVLQQIDAAKGHANIAKVALGGVPASLTIDSLDTAPAAGTAVDLRLHLTLKDADGYVITAPGNYTTQDGRFTGVGVSILANPFLPGLQPVSLTVNGHGNRVVIQSPGDTYALRYNGLPIYSVAVALRAGNLTGNATITPIPAFPAVPESPHLEASSVILPYRRSNTGDATAWFTEPSRHAISTTAGSNVVRHVLPSGHTPTTLAAGDPSKSQIFFGTAEGTVGIINSKSGQISEVAVKNASGAVVGMYYLLSSDTAYFTESGGAIGTFSNGTITQTSTGAGSHPGNLVYDEGYFGFCFPDTGRHAIGCFQDPSSIIWSVIPKDDTIGTVFAGNSIWFTEPQRHRIGQMTNYDDFAERAVPSAWTSIAFDTRSERLMGTDVNGNVDAIPYNGSMKTYTTGSNGPATGIVSLFDQIFYICPGCSHGVHRFYF